MLKRSTQKPDTDGFPLPPRPRNPVSPYPRVAASPRLRLCLLLAAYCILFSGCRQDMQDQPRMKPFRSTAFFSDGLSSRPPVTGTVPRGFLRADKEFFTGKKRTATATTGSNTATPAGAGTQATYPDDIEEFPMPISQDVVAHGRERFEIFCSVCHGMTGNGDGMIVRRGYRRAASFHTDALRQAPVGHYFDAITNGWGAMPSYAAQIPPRDRWAIVAYIRALQLSNTQSQTGVSPAPAAAHAATPESGGHR